MTWYYMPPTPEEIERMDQERKAYWQQWEVYRAAHPKPKPLVVAPLPAPLPFGVSDEAAGWAMEAQP